MQKIAFICDFASYLHIQPEMAEFFRIRTHPEQQTLLEELAEGEKLKHKTPDKFDFSFENLLKLN